MSATELAALKKERALLESHCNRLGDYLRQLCVRLVTIHDENSRLEAQWKSQVDGRTLLKSSLERTKYYAYLDFENHYVYAKHDNIRTESHLSIPAIIGEILTQIDVALYADKGVDVLVTLKSRFLRTMKGFKNKKAPKQILTSHNGEQFFIRADRKDHLQSLFGRDGLLQQLKLCPLLVRVGCEASKTTEALADVCAPRGTCTCAKHSL